MNSCDHIPSELRKKGWKKEQNKETDKEKKDSERKKKQSDGRTDLPPVWEFWEVWSGQPSEPRCPPHRVGPLHERRMPPWWTPLASSWLLLPQQQGGGEDEEAQEGGRKVVEKEKERSAADRFCFSLRVEEETGCFQESLRIRAPPTQRRRGEGSERAVQHTCLFLSLPLCNARSVWQRRMSLLFLPFHWLSTHPPPLSYHLSNLCPSPSPSHS